MKYRFVTTFIALLFGINGTLAQEDYIKYYNLINQANQHWYEKEYELALEDYLTGFEQVQYVHTINFVKAARTAAKLKRYDLTQQFITNAIKGGYPIDIVDRKEYKKFRKTSEYRDLKSNLATYQKEYENTINRTYQIKIDSLHYIDQLLIRGNNRVKPFNIKGKTFSDSLNFACLLQLIKEYGFPSEQNIGYNGYRKSWVIIHHNARLPQNHHYHPMLLDALKKGEYQPENYCWVIDQGQTQLKQEPIYFHWDVATNIDQLTKEEKQQIDQLRLKVGMPSIKRIEPVKTKKGKKNKVNW